MRALVVGYGFVGKATVKQLQLFGVEDIAIHDPDLLFNVDETEEFDIVFLCVPTNLKGNKLDTSILESVYGKWKGEQVIRSTIGPDQVDKFDNPTMWPEFLREITWEDQLTQPEVEHVIGFMHTSKLAYFLDQIEEPYTETAPVEAAMFKISRNAFLATKVTFANLLNSKCQQLDIDYNMVKSLLETNIDPTTHFDVPGPDGARGFGGKCLPKDTTHYGDINDDLLSRTILQINKAIR